MVDEIFAHGNSFLHRRDPRVKIIGATCLITTVALINSFTAVSAALVFALSLTLVASLPLSAVLKRILVVNSFTLFLWITLPLTYNGDRLYQLWFLNLSLDGIVLATLITLKTNTIILTIIALITTSTIAQLGSGLDRLHFPQKICFLLLYSYRYIFVIYQEYSRLLRAAKMRSFTPKTNLHTYRTYAYLFGMTLVKSYNRARRVHQAMLLRGFSGRLVSLYRHTIARGDVMLLGLIFLVNVSIIYLTLVYC